MGTSHKIYLILVILCILVYANALKNDFMYDDIPAIIESPLIRDPGNFIFNLPMLVNSLIYQTAGENPFLYRSANVLAHGLITVLVFIFLRLFFGVEPSFLGSALFAVHPIHTEAVVWITAGNYLYFALYILSIYLLYRKATDPVSDGKKLNIAFYISSLAIFTYSLVQHFMSFALLSILLFLLFDLTFKRWRWSWKYWLPFFAVLFIRLILAKALISQRVEDAVWQIQGKESHFIIDMIYSLSIHLGILLWPARLTLYHDPVITSPLYTGVGIVVLIGIVCLLPYLYMRAKVIFFAIGIFALFLLPTYSPIPVTSLIGERYVYFSSIALSMFVAYFYQRYASDNKTIRRNALIVFSIILIAFSIRTTVRNEDWRTEPEFWRKTALTSPNSAFSHNSLGFVYQREGRMEEAIREYEIALAIKPNLLPAYNNLAIIYRTMDKKGEAIAIYDKILEMYPRFMEGYNNLGALYSELGNYEEAEKNYRKAIEIEPLYSYSYYNLGRLYEQMGKREEAQALFDKAFQIYPRLRYELGQSLPEQTAQGKQLRTSVATFNNPAAEHNAAGIKFIMSNKFEQAIEEFQKAIEIEPKFADAYNNLGNAYNAVGKTKEAIESYNKAIDINPGNAVAHFNLCVSYVDSQQLEVAATHCSIASQLGYKVPKDLSDQLKPYSRNIPIGDVPKRDTPGR